MLASTDQRPIDQHTHRTIFFLFNRLFPQSFLFKFFKTTFSFLQTILINPFSKCISDLHRSPTMKNVHRPIGFVEIFFIRLMKKELKKRKNDE